MIHFLRKTTRFPIIWTFSPPEEKDRAKEAVKALISQTLEIIPKRSMEELAQNLSSNEEPSEERLFQFLHYVLCCLDKCFIVVEMKHSALAKRFQDTFQRAINGPEANFKAVIISYNTLWKCSHNSTTQNAIMPSVRLRGSKPGWDACWNRSKPVFK